MYLNKTATYVFIFLVYPFLNQAQTPQITVSPPAIGDIVTVCEEESLEFTASPGGLFSEDRSFAFYVIRVGSITPTLLQARSDTPTLEIRVGLDADQLQDSDTVFARVWDSTTVEGGDTFTDTPRQIIIQMIPKPRPTLFDDTTGHIFCSNEPVNFRALPVAADRYVFFINGNEVQDSDQDSFGPITTLSDQDVVRVDVFVNGCMGSSSLQMTENQVRNGGEIIFAGTNPTVEPVYVCYNTPPPLIQNRVAAIFSGEQVADADPRYQWYSSVDGVVWNNLNHSNANFQPSALVTTTFFRRDFTNTLSGNACTASSNVLQVIVAQENQGGETQTLSQTICYGEQPSELVVINGVNGPNVRYQWESSTDGINFSPVDVFGTSERYQPPSLLESTLYRRRTSILTAQCSETSQVFEVRVIHVSPGILDPNQSRSICYGSENQFTFDDLPLVPGNPGQEAQTDPYTTLRYQWEQSLDNGVQWNVIPHGDQKALTVSGPWEQTTLYRRNVMGSADGVLCSPNYSQNNITVSVHAEIIPPNIEGPHFLCEDNIAGTLTLTAIDLAEPLNIQWEISADGTTFNSVSGAQSVTLELDSFTLTQTLYFRAEITHRSTFCQVYSVVHSVDFGLNHTLDQIQGPNRTQEVCPGDLILPLVFKYGGGATDISAIGINLAASGLQIIKDPIGKTLTVSGTPNHSLNLKIITIGNSCETLQLNHDIQQIPQARLPDVINADRNFLKFGDSQQTTTYRICEGTEHTQFSVEIWDSEIQNAITFIWELVTLDAGTIDRDTGLMRWRNTPESYHGTAQFRMAGVNSCGQQSNWTTFEVEVLQNQIPTTPPEAIGNIFSSTPEPTCPITADHEPTNYEVGVTSDNNNEDLVGGVVWSLEVLEVGNPDAPSPGTIDNFTGILSWSPGFWGRINIIADPINCDGDTDPTLRRIYTLNIPDYPPANFDVFLDTNQPNNSLPECSASTLGHITLFNTNLSDTYARFWSINNSDAGQMDAATGELHWNPHFYGTVEVQLTIAQDPACEPRQQSIQISVPRAAVVTLTSDPTTAHQSLCRGEAVDEIQYRILGDHTNASISGLPRGIQGNYISQNQISQLNFIGSVTNSNTLIRIQINNQLYTYTTQSDNENGSIVASAFENLLANDRNINVQQRNGNQLILESQVNAATFQIQVITTPPELSVQTQQIQEASSEIVIDGTPEDDPGIYRFVIQAEGMLDNCNSEVIEGSIEVLNDSTISLTSGNANQSVCNSSPLVPIRFSINHAFGVDVAAPTAENNFLDGLPKGIVLSFQNGEAMISGTPEVSISLPTIYHYTLLTRNNSNGCQETVYQGSITVTPQQGLEPLNHANTNIIQVCAGDELTGIQYQLSAPLLATNFVADLSQLPDGVSGVYSSTSLVYSLVGSPIPSPELDRPTDYPYTITISNCTGLVTHTQNLRVFPRPSLVLLSGEASERQEICTSAPLMKFNMIFEEHNNSNSEFSRPLIG